MDPDGNYVDEQASDGGLDASDAQVTKTPSPGGLSADDHDPDTTAVDSRRRHKRNAQGAPAYRPFKRQKGVLNTEYLDLLNQDIDDAAHRVCLDDDADLPCTQVGLTVWSPLEKRQFYEALSRLGRHDLPGIAARVGSKSLVEVQHYINFLQEAHSLRRRLDRRSFLETAEYSAAVELSQQCCHAQEEAADAVSLKQEQHEMRREERKWGDCWDVTPGMAAKLSRGRNSHADQPLPFARLFNLPRWLSLSERFFMNSSIPGSNWHFVDDVPPSIWATSLDDFYSLAVSITRRLIQTTLYISMSRIRAKRALIPSTRDIVRRKDAEAAIASLGMAPDARDFWLKSARRLRLDVYEEPPDRDDESDEEPMTYDEVEGALCPEQDGDGDGLAGADIFKRRRSPDDDEEVDDEDEDEEDADATNGSEEDDMSLENQEDYEISCEAREVLWYSAVDLRDVLGARQALKRRIAMERRQEEQADGCDAYASYRAEADMWAVLHKKPPPDMPKKQDPGRPERSNLDVESVYPMARDWASRLAYRGEWETLDEASRAQVG